MKLISRFNAASYNEAELRGHLRQVFNALATAPLGSMAHFSALLSMETIDMSGSLKLPKTGI